MSAGVLEPGPHPPNPHTLTHSLKHSFNRKAKETAPKFRTIDTKHAPNNDGHVSSQKYKPRQKVFAAQIAIIVDFAIVCLYSVCMCVFVQSQCS